MAYLDYLYFGLRVNKQVFVMNQFWKWLPGSVLTNARRCFNKHNFLICEVYITCILLLFLLLLPLSSHSCPQTPDEKRRSFPAFRPLPPEPPSATTDAAMADPLGRHSKSSSKCQCPQPISLLLIALVVTQLHFLCNCDMFCNIVYGSVKVSCQSSYHVLVVIETIN